MFFTLSQTSCLQHKRSEIESVGFWSYFLHYTMSSLGITTEFYSPLTHQSPVPSCNHVINSMLPPHLGLNVDVSKKSSWIQPLLYLLFYHLHSKIISRSCRNGKTLRGSTNMKDSSQNSFTALSLIPCVKIYVIQKGIFHQCSRFSSLWKVTLKMSPPQKTWSVTTKQ